MLFQNLIAKVGAKVKAGDVIFYDKSNEDVKFVSPVSGNVIEVFLVVLKEKLIAIKIQADKEQSYVTILVTFNLNSDAKAKTLKHICWLQGVGLLLSKVLMMSLLILRNLLKLFLFLHMQLHLWLRI